MRGERGDQRNEKASSLKPWQEDQALHAKTTPEPSAPDICCIKGVEVHVRDTRIYSEDGVKGTRTHQLETGPTSTSLYPSAFCTWTYVSVLFP